MSVLVVGAEKTLTALHPRLFAGRVSRTAAARVAEALREANPGVDLQELRPGTVLRIPELPELTRRRPGLSLDEVTAEAGVGLLGAVGDALDALAAVAARREDEDAGERKDLAQVLKARALTAAAGADPDIAAELKAVRTALAEEERQAEGRGPALKRARAAWGEDLAALGELMA